MNIFQKCFAYLRLREAIRKADEAHRLHHRRFFVLPAQGRSLLVMDRANFRILKRKGYIPSRASVPDAIGECFYFTPHADGSGLISEPDRRLKFSQYFAWYAQALKNKGSRKKKKGSR